MSDGMPKPLLWNMGKSGTYTCIVLPQACQLCGKQALTILPPPVLKRQPDRTNVVCHPSLGGCNHGFEMSDWPVNTTPSKPRKRERRGSYGRRS